MRWVRAFLGRMKENVIGVLLLCLSLCLCVLLLDLVILPSGLARAPKGLWRFILPDQLFALTLRTKQGLLPRHYLGLLGDSFAIGLGDEWERMPWWQNRGLGVGARIFAKGGREVMVFAKAGAGSVEPVMFALLQPQLLSRSVFYKLEPPSELLVFFYEGNDVENNLYFLAQKFAPGHDLERVRDPEYFQRFLESEIFRKHVYYRKGRSFAWHDNFFGTKKTLQVGLTHVNYLAGELLVRMGFPQPMYRRIRYLDLGDPGSYNQVSIAQERISLRSFLQGPALDLSDEQVSLGVYVFEQCLRFLRERLPDTRIVVAYLPSVLSVYEVVSPQVSVEQRNQHPGYFTPEQVRQRSESMAGLVRAAAEGQGCVFVDTRPALREAATQSAVHGPRDWKHFNKTGYDVLTDAILPKLKAGTIGEKP